MESLPAQMESGPTEQPLYSQEVLPHSSAPLISSNHIFQLNLQPTLAKSSPSVHTSTVPPGQFSTGGSPTVVNAGPFQVKLLTPAIRVCAGCRGGYNPEGGNSPSNVILVRKEQHLYYNVVTGRQQASSMMNVHYHANLSCPRVCDVSPLTLLRLKFHRKLEPSYHPNNGSSLSRPLGSTNYFCFCIVILLQQLLMF